MKRACLIFVLAGSLGVGPVPAQTAADIPNPLSWQECVNLTLQHNVSLRQAETQLEEAEGAKLEFRSRSLPQVNMTALTFPPLILLDARQMVFDQRAILAWEASNLAGSVSRLNYELRVNEVMTTLRLAYLNVLFVQQQEALTQELQDFLAQRTLNAKSMFETGQLRKSELQQVEVRLSLIKNSITLLLDEKEKAKTRLLDVMGVGQAMGAVSGEFEVLPERAVDRTAILKTGLMRMPEVRLLEKLAEASDYQARIARADRYPNVYFYARGEFSPGLDDIIGGQDRSENSVTNTAEAAGAVGAAAVGIGTGSSGSGSTSDPTTDTTGFGDSSSNLVASDDDDEFEKSRALFGLQLRWVALDGGASEGRGLRRDADRDEALAMIEEFRQVLPGQVEEAAEGIEMAREVLVANEAMLNFSESLKLAQSEYEGDRAGQNETLAFALDSFRMHSRMMQERYRASIALTILRRISGQLLAFTGESGN